MFDHQRRRHLTLSVVFCACAATALLASSAFALHRESPASIRVTRNVSHNISAGRMWGNDMVFTSTVDLALNGNTTQQIFLFDLLQWVCQNGTPEPQTEATCPNPPVPFLQQVTFSPVGLPDNPSIAQDSGTCSLQANQTCNDNADCQTNGNAGTCIIDSQWMAFDALGSFGGGVGPQALRRQVFLKNIKSNELRRITGGADGDSSHASVNSLGGIVSFESTAGTSGVSQIFVYERKQNITRQITFGQGPSRRAIPNRTGELIVFESRADLTGTGVDTGIWNIFYAKYDKQNHTATIHRVTNGNGDSINGFVSEIGKRITFESVATNIGAVLGGSSIYRADISTTPPVITQLTQFPSYGNCHNPTLSVQGDRIAFTCDGDPLQNGTSGQRLFELEDISNGLKLRQMTGQGDVPGPISHGLGLWFLNFATTSDMDGDGSCGTQIHIINFFDQEGPGHWQGADELGELPPDVAGLPPGGSPTGYIGRRNFIVNPGNEIAGSTAQLITRDGAVPAMVESDGFFPLIIGAPGETTQLSSISIPAGQTALPSVMLSGVGVLCMTPTDNGAGFIDCNGGNGLGDLQISQDHNVDDTDPGCVLGCRESALGQTVGGGPECRGDWPGPHQVSCPTCVGGFCDSGFNAGQACTSDGQCQPSECQNGLMGVCNGSPKVTASGVTQPGDMQLQIRANITLSTSAGFDGTYCTFDDTYAVSDFPAMLQLSTGNVLGVITDADNLPAASLNSASNGVPFSCVSLEAGETFGARLVGSLTLLDVPNVPGLRDGVLEMRLEPRPVPGACDTICTGDVDCSDGDACNGVETCQNGVCIAGAAPPPCGDSDPCNGIEMCDPATGACLTGPPCDDGDPCNGTEICDPVNGCLLGTPVVCDDFNACNGTETCDPTTGGCLSGTPPACDDGDACDGVETCDPATGCEPGTPVDCQDGDFCNGTEGCDPLTGACLPPPGPLVCDDGNPCTDDSCSSSVGCAFVDNTLPCDDGSACTSGDTCAAGACTGVTTIFCDDGDVCDGLELCNPLDGSCLPGIPLICDDLNSCTSDSCDSSAGCAFVDNTLPCDDGNACTTGDTCGGGTCNTTPVVCDDGDFCNGFEGCDPLTGLCLPGVPTVCDDSNPCTSDSCDSSAGCAFVDNTLPCDDGNPCTSGDICGGGTCNATPLVCDDGNICNGFESCDPLSGCVSSGPLVCDDGNECTTDACVPGVGCVFTNNSAGCDDGDLCTTGDTCGGGSCTGTPTLCDDGNLCNGTETCNSSTGACESSGPLDCDDGEQCTNDACNPFLGCVHSDATGSCNDGDACTTGDTCGSGTCTGTTDLECVLSALQSLIQNSAPADLGGTRSANKFLRQVIKARLRIERGLLGDPSDQFKNLNRARKTLGKVVSRVTKLVNKSRMDPVLGASIQALANQAIDGILELINP